MKYSFQFARKDQVVVLDYDEPRKEHNAVVLRRWLEEDEQSNIQEHYDVLLNGSDGKPQQCEFLAADMRKMGFLSGKKEE